MPNHVHCAHILVKTEQEAKAVLERLNKGEKFANIAREVLFVLQENAVETLEPSAVAKW